MSEVKSLQFKANDQAPIQLLFFGSFELRVHDHPVTELSGAAKRILTLLALGRKTTILRERLACALWPDAPQDRSLFYLRRCLSECRTALGAERHRIVSHTGSALSLDLDGAACDSLRFEYLIQHETCDSMEEAISLYRGEFLQGFDDDWAIIERRRCSEGYREALDWLSNYRNEEGDNSGAIRICRLLIEDEPLNEKAHCHLMELLAKKGDFMGVEIQYRKLRGIFYRELNLEPSVATS